MVRTFIHWLTLRLQHNHARYNRAGVLTSETYPSGRIVSIGYDGANRLHQLSGTLAGQTTNYVTQAGYTPHGAPNYYQYGNNVHPVFNYNNRLQLMDVYETLHNDPNQFLFYEHLDWGGTNNNGHPAGLTLQAGGPGALSSLPPYQQTFGYDQVNRLTSAQEAGGWSRSFGYDQYSNMWISSATGMAPSGNAPTANVFNGQNQINGGNYDKAGNQLWFNGNLLTYDADNHVNGVSDPITNVSESLLYDGLGQRVAKQTWDSVKGTLLSTTVSIYDAFGQRVAEYASAPFGAPACVTCYLSYDHLGSVRLVTDGNGAVVSRHDYLPFGDEIPAGTAGRNSQFSAQDRLGPKFTGQVRDGESGLDFFQARYYGSSLGRFTSPDPGNAGPTFNCVDDANVMRDGCAFLYYVKNGSRDTLSKTLVFCCFGV